MTYLLVGHVTLDLLPAEPPRLGGTVIYAGLTVAACGWPVEVVTSVAGDAPTLPPGLRYTVVPAARMTTFRIEQGADGRRLMLTARAAPLSAQAFRGEDWPEVVHLAPVMGECGADWVERFHGRAFLGATLQGWLRAPDAHGQVRYAPWADAEKVLPYVNVAVLSREDVEGVETRLLALARLSRMLVVTDGPRGVTWYEDYGRRVVRAPVIPQVEVDATGAGDIFAAWLFMGLQQGMPMEAAVRRAAWFAGRSVTRRGLAGVSTAEDMAAYFRMENRD